MAALRGEVGETDYLGKIRESREVMKKVLEDRPIKHEGVLTYAFERAPVCEVRGMDLLKRLVRVGEIPTGWMERWFSGSIDLIDSLYRDETVGNLKQILGKMDSDDELALRSWNNDHHNNRELILQELSGIIQENNSSAK